MEERRYLQLPQSFIPADCLKTLVPLSQYQILKEYEGFLFDVAFSPYSKEIFKEFNFSYRPRIKNLEKFNPALPFLESIYLLTSGVITGEIPQNRQVLLPDTGQTQEQLIFGLTNLLKIITLSQAKEIKWGTVYEKELMQVGKIRQIANRDRVAREHNFSALASYYPMTKRVEFLLRQYQKSEDIVDNHSRSTISVVSSGNFFDQNKNRHLITQLSVQESVVTNNGETFTKNNETSYLLDKYFGRDKRQIYLGIGPAAYYAEIQQDCLKLLGIEELFALPEVYTK